MIYKSDIQCPNCSFPLNMDEYILKSDLRKLVSEMREDEMKPYLTSTLQGYHEASGDWADRIEQLLKREGE